MLSQYDLKLLTGWVDGELTRGESAVVERLLRQSGEARSLLEGLEEDARRLRGLPRARLGGDFAERVLKRFRA